MQSDRWTRSLTHSKLCVYKSNVSSSRPHFQERSRYLSYNPKFPFALFSVCLVPQKQEEKERKNVVSGFLHNHFLSLLCVEFQHFSNGYSCFDCLLRYFFFFSLLFVCMWVWMLVVAAKRAWEHRLVCCNTLFMGIEYPMRMLWWILCCAQSVRWNAFSSLACRFRVTPLVPEGQVCF